MYNKRRFKKVEKTKSGVMVTAEGDRNGALSGIGGISRIGAPSKGTRSEEPALRQEPRAIKDTPSAEKVPVNGR